MNQDADWPDYPRFMIAAAILHPDGNIGCPHEEVQDYARGEVCPFCPYW